MPCNHNYVEAWFYKNMYSRRYQCIKCGKIINSKTFQKWFRKKLEQAKKKSKK